MFESVTIFWRAALDCVVFCRPITSLRAALPGRGSDLWPLPQLISQCGAVDLERSGRAAHSDALEAPGVG